MDNVILFSACFMVILASASSAIVARNDCRNVGPCVKATSCESALKLFEESNIKKLRSLFCGFENGHPKVCCPPQENSNIYFYDETETATRRTNRKTITTEQFDATTMQPSTSIPSDIDIFPNRTVCGRTNITFPSRVSGGSITELTEFPWLALIKYKNSVTNKSKKAFCSASLITDRYLVTAAHCVQNKGKIKAVSVRLGEWDVETEIDCYKNLCSDKPVDINISKIITHPLFNERNKANDIALIKLAESVKFTGFIQPVCLPTTEYVAEEDYVDGTSYWTAGWGLTEFETMSAIKRKVQLESVPIETCQQILPYIREPSKVICAGGRKEKDTCKGDSGGSLVREIMEEYQKNWYLFGVTSFGDTACGVEGKPGVYTRITPFMEWIRETVRT